MRPRPSTRLKRPSDKSGSSAALVRSIKGSSRRKKGARVASGVTRALTPKMSPMLAMFEPITLPSAIPALPRSAAVRLAASSGALVPKATTVKPMTRELTPSRRARRDAKRTSRSPPTNSPPSPRTMRSAATFRRPLANS